MKKKILSLLCAFSMITTLVTTINIASAAGASFEATVEEKQFSEELVGFPQYEVKITMKDIPDIAPLTVSGSISKKYTGNAVFAYQAYLKFDNTKFFVLDDLAPGVNVGTFTSNANQETGVVNFNWQTTKVAEMITSPDQVLVTLHFVATADGENPGDKLENAKNIVSFSDESGKNSKVQVATFNNCAAGAYTNDINYVAGTNLINVVKPLVEEPVLADFTALNAAIAAYEAKTEADYTAESWATAKAAYDTAKAIDQTAETDQTVVDAATTALNAAIAALELKPVDKVEVKPDTTVIKKDNSSGLWTFGFGGTVEITGSKTFSKLIFTLEDTVNSKTGSYTWDFETPINANVTYGLNIKGCPVDSNVTATVEAQ